MREVKFGEFKHGDACEHKNTGCTALILSKLQDKIVLSQMRGNGQS
jgi:hypothetical protein